MKPDDFEKQLQRQPLRKVPAGWRTEILRAAHDSVAADVRRLHLPDQNSPGLLTSAATSWWREWLWPCPQAWAGLAIIWVIIAGLNATTPAGPANLAERRPAPSAETDTSLAAQRRELARLLDNNFSDQAPAPKPPPGPRSEGASPSKV